MDYSPGLRGVIAGETAISTVGKEGTSLRYRGYDATDLTSNNTYEEVASLIVTDSLEDKNFKKSFSKYYLETTKDSKLNELLTEIKEKLEALDDMLILYAEHGFNASTFATRVTASTRADLTGAIVSGIATLKGELHGGANERAVELINSFDTVDDAEKGIKALLEQKTKIMGFGHGVYKIQDPRSPIVKNWVSRLVNSDESKNRFEIAQKIDEIMDEEKNLFPNVDFYGGLLLAELGFEVDLFTPIFVAGRSVGWASHYFEQREQDILIRPAAKYIGPSER